MTSKAVGSDDRIFLDFRWQGPNTRKGGSSYSGLEVRVVDLAFTGAKSAISVHLPENINPVKPKKLHFTCRRYQETESGDRSLEQETHPASLLATIEQVRHLTIKARFFERGKPIGPAILNPSTGKITQQKTITRTDSNVRLEIPEELEVGQKYNLMVTSENLSLSALLVKEKTVASTIKDKASTDEREFRRQEETRVKNLKLASTTSTDAFAPALSGFVHACQLADPDTRGPYTYPSESPSDLDKLSAAELQKRYEEIFKKSEELEIQHLETGLSGKLSELAAILKAELANNQLLLNLDEALARKGFQVQLIQTKTSITPSFQAMASKSLE